jgi:hypothetical protein
MDVKTTGLRRLAHGVSTDPAPMWLLCVLFGLELLWASAHGLTVTQLDEAIGLVIFPFVAGLVLNALGLFPRAANIAYGLAFWMGLFLTGAMLSYLTAGMRIELFDARFEALDEILGFRWMTWFDYQLASPALRKLLEFAYATMHPQMVFAMIYFSRPSRRLQARELWWAAMVALLVTAVLSGVWPALGTYQHYGVWLERAVHLPHLIALRDGTLATVPMLELRGIITLPSYHSVMAVLLAWVYRRERLLFPVACCLNAAMLLSVPTHGGHYLVDVIAGCAVAALAIFLVTSFDAWRSRVAQWFGAGVPAAEGARHAG